MKRLATIAKFVEIKECDPSTDPEKKVQSLDQQMREEKRKRKRKRKDVKGNKEGLGGKQCYWSVDIEVGC